MVNGNITQVDVMNYGFVQGIFDGFNFGGALLVLVLVGISAVAITRDTRNMRLLLFPLVFGWSRIGLDVPTYLLAGSAIVSVVTLVGVHNIGATLGALQGAVTERFRGSAVGERRARKRAVQSAEQDFELQKAMEPLELKKSQDTFSKFLEKAPIRIMKREQQLREDVKFAERNEELLKAKKEQAQDLDSYLRRRKKRKNMRGERVIQENY